MEAFVLVVNPPSFKAHWHILYKDNRSSQGSATTDYKYWYMVDYKYDSTRYIHSIICILPSQDDLAANLLLGTWTWYSPVHWTVWTNSPGHLCGRQYQSQWFTLSWPRSCQIGSLVIMELMGVWERLVGACFLSSPPHLLSFTLPLLTLPL